MSAQPLTFLIARGRSVITVECVILTSGRMPVTEFLDELQKLIIKRLPPQTARMKVATQFQIMADAGSVPAKRFKKEMGVFYAFKFEIGNKQIRFPCFRDGNKWIVTHGFFKPGAQKGLGAWPAEQENRAAEIKSEYDRRKKLIEEKKR